MDNIEELFDAVAYIRVNADILFENSSSLYNSINAIYLTMKNVTEKTPKNFRVQFDIDIDNRAQLMDQLNMAVTEIRRIRGVIEDLICQVQPIEADASILNERLTGKRKRRRCNDDGDDGDDDDGDNHDDSI